MAAPTGKPPDALTKDVLSAPQRNDLENFNFILNHVIGEEKIKTNVFLPSMYGAGARTKQEQMISRVFESCAFKATLSGVLGELSLTSIYPPANL